jgi:hypothetical protein
MDYTQSTASPIKLSTSNYRLLRYTNVLAPLSRTVILSGIVAASVLLLQILAIAVFRVKNMGFHAVRLEELNANDRIELTKMVFW